jgi:hypothetical protein
VIDEQRLALFIMLGQSVSAAIEKAPELVPPDSLTLSEKYELATMMPEAVRRSTQAAESYRLFFVFEGYLREFISQTLIGKDADNWWNKVPPDVQEEVAKLEHTEEAKSWMALGSRDKTSLMTYPQLLKVIDHCWKSHFEELLRDKALVQQARLIGHLRNTICHMTNISSEELERVRQTMRDWFRRIPP